MRGDVLQPIDPFRVRSLDLRKRSLLRKTSPLESYYESQTESTTAQRYVHFVKPKKKKRGRRGVRFAPLVDVFETVLPDDFTEEEFESLWISGEDYENAKQEFSDVIMTMQTDVLDSADLLIDENELPPDHPMVKYCVRGCEKYFDLETRYKIRGVVTEKVVEFFKEHPEDHEAVAVFSQALTAECSDLAYFHGKLNALQCWGKTLQRYQDLKQSVSRHIFAYYSISQSFPIGEDSGISTSCGIEVILDPSTMAG
uniref:Uncharacterized protein n=1 Tax=Amphora coffeiformis TaxID=265554 RepID=A0A7S3L5I1_9STRA|mmetsp:Transcript_1752/g.3841  ORF Transcript_1752/g.3841 Transcript_1752/m.3841 type:complete len:255 (-) Transcript_1752:167-931(-)|eukprot:scaffold3234_cov166-Amphora_coffeaeformis.AAC.14